MNYNYITIEGNIGAGKTSLAKRIAGEYDAKLILEQFEDNSFLPKFYQNPDKYAFPLEMSFLAERYQQLKEQLPSQDLFKSFTISDYFIDKSLIFARNNLKGDEISLYSRLFNIISSFLPRPDLIAYLHLNTEGLLENIKQRGREYEKSIKASYLDDIQEGYFRHFRTNTQSRILIIDTSWIDFVNDSSDYEKVRNVIMKPYDPGIHRIVL
jgi:deoxyadenosine/deoxycytidine kinase